MAEEKKNVEEAGAKAPASDAPSKKVKFKKVKGKAVKLVVIKLAGQDLPITEDMLQNPRLIKRLKALDEARGTNYCSHFE